MKKLYIKAVADLLLKGNDPKEVLKNLEAALVKKGHQGIQLQILEGVARELEQKQGRTHPTITVANEKDTDELKTEIAASLKTLGGELKSAHIAIDKTLTGGYIATHQGQTIDASYKTKLLKLYRTITN